MVKKQWLSPAQRVEMEEAGRKKHPEEGLKKKDITVYDPYISAPFADQIFKEKVTHM